MKPLQQDDIQDWLNQPKRKWKWSDTISGKTVKAENKKEALKAFQMEHNIIAIRKNVFLI